MRFANKLKKPINKQQTSADFLKAWDNSFVDDLVSSDNTKIFLNVFQKFPKLP